MASLYDYCYSHLQVIKERLPELHCVCPWCGDTRGKFQFNLEKGVGRCWRASCNERAGLVKLIAKVENIPIYLAAKQAAAIKPQDAAAPQVRTYDAIGSLPHGTLPIESIEKVYPQLQPAEQLTVQAGLLYLFEKRNMSYDVAVNAGCAIGVEGYWFGRIIFPAIEDGIVVNCTGRAIEIELGKDVWVKHPHVTGEKYLHCSNESGYLEKQHIVYGIDSVHAANEVVVVEDCFSAVALTAAGYPAISPWGVSMTKEQRTKLNSKWNVKDRKIIVMLDPDAAVVARKLAGQLLSIAQVSIATLPEKDPDEDIPAAIAAIEHAKPYTDLDALESLILCQH